MALEANRECILMSCSETKQKTLEEIAATFGDRVVEVDERQIASEAIAIEGKAGSESEHLEGYKQVAA